MFTDISEYTKHNPEWIGSVDLLVKPPTREELLEEHPECAVDISDLGGDYRKAHYMMMRRNGETHNMSAMAASSRAPKCVTDREFFEGIGSIHDQFDADTPRGRIQMEKVLGVTKANGYTPGRNDVYCSHLARYQGDPEAYVPATGGRNYVRRLCEQRGSSCDGYVKVAHREPENDPMDTKKALGEDIIQGRMRSMVHRSPELRTKSRRELRDMIVDKHSPKGY